MPRPTIPDQSEAQDRFDTLTREAAALEKQLGANAPQRPAISPDDLLAAVDTLDAHVARLRAQTRIIKPTPSATTAPKAPASSAPTAPTKPLTLTEKCRAAKARARVLAMVKP